MPKATPSRLRLKASPRPSKMSLPARCHTNTLRTLLSVSLGCVHFFAHISSCLTECSEQRINDWFVVLEESVTHHPYRTILFVLAFLVVIFIAIRRLLAEDLPSYADYTKMQKAPSRLD